ncbi:MAG: class I adenylate-forming enzyme family protein [Clostridia bacterium]|nr:class I adenylate-forming enzyme family protein [Clostridia bacterium]
MNNNLTGYPSIDKPWLKYYTEEQINSVIPEKLVYDYMRDRNKNNLNLTAITFMGQEYTYAQLFEIIDKAADALLSLGVSEGEVITMLIPVCPEEVFLFYAINKIGAISNFIMPATPKEKVCAIMNEHESRFLFAFPFFLEDEAYIYDNTKCKNIILTQGIMEYKNTNTLVWDNFLSMADKCDKKGYKTKKNPKDTMFIAKTGGTTGVSKSVMLSDNAFNAAVDQIITAVKEYKTGDRWLRLWPAFSATVAAAAIHLPLSVGMNNTFDMLEDFKDFDNLVMKYKPNHLELFQC